MFIKRTHPKTALDEVIDDVIAELKGHETKDQEYAIALAHLDQLYKLKQLDQPERVSRDTMAIVVGNLIGIIVIVGHERAHIVTSKALNFVMKSK